ncbi:class I SAM-dependent methyltransferase [Fortiea sp. LEGE XX443]|uniref:class I SAM-dependent methyltransferase n=1 Tax=Fortiea sp. LEGE XX443 TaxID=1828611 RepID=UPI00188073C4|nr:class I SAM-dependent methyltransferase [Fortiea sp. LEGE XX443]MBE9007107.1 class I SAM-dependent methyltransferase [Fortiea sp. LEGE XX443]
MNYNKLHVDWANEQLNVNYKKVLVAGCNTGKECNYFVELGAKEVWGIDLLPEVGKDYVHSRIKYFQMSVENMSIDDNSFDLTFCFATMEHVSNIEAAFLEMVRVTKPNGIIYCIAAPLWNSRQGHHKQHIFDVDKYPWIHIRLDKDEIKNKCRNGEILVSNSVSDINAHIEHMFDGRYFNFQPAQKYIEICSSIENIKIIRNDLDLENEDFLTPDISEELSKKGYSRTELLALTHTFIARKIATEPSLEEQLEKLKLILQNTESEIVAMKSSKFWKLRMLWFRFKKLVGLPAD